MSSMIRAMVWTVAMMVCAMLYTINDMHVAWAVGTVVCAMVVLYNAVAYLYKRWHI
jgi:hypothetical protein